MNADLTATLNAQPVSAVDEVMILPGEFGRRVRLGS
jgi:hypothetical protein